MTHGVLAVVKQSLTMASLPERDLHRREPPVHRKGGACSSSSCTVGLPHPGVVSLKDLATDSERALISALSQPVCSQVAWLEAPTDEMYTFEVDCPLVSGSGTLFSFVTEYDVPDA